MADPPGHNTEAFVWKDGSGRAWRIEVGAEALRLSEGDQAFEIPQERYDKDVYFADLKDRAIVRICGAEQEVGFLVSQNEAEQLRQRISGSYVEPQATGQARLPTETRFVSQEQPRLLWPNMSGKAVWALILSAFAFLPYVGLLFAVVAGYLIIRQWREARPTLANLHIRRMCIGAAICCVWGTSVWALSTWSWEHPLGAEIVQSARVNRPAAGQFSWPTIILGMLVLLFSLSVHEASHAVTALWCGDDYARSLGRVTLNPMSHIDPFGTVLLPILLAMSGMPTFGFARPVPVQLHSVRNYRRAHILIAVAGPGSNLFLAAWSFSLLLTLGCLLRFTHPTQAVAVFSSLRPIVTLQEVPLSSVLSIVVAALKLMVVINIVLAFFNLIPVPPLDGSWVLEHLFPDTLGRFYERIRPFGFIIFVVLMLTRTLGPLILPAFVVIAAGSAILSCCVAGSWAP